MDCGEFPLAGRCVRPIPGEAGVGAVLDDWLTDREFEFALMESGGVFVIPSLENVKKLALVFITMMLAHSLEADLAPIPEA